MKSNIIKMVTVCMSMMVLAFSADDVVAKNYPKGYIHSPDVVKHENSTPISEWTDSEFKSHLTGEKESNFGKMVYVSGERASDHTFESCVDYWASEGSFYIYSYSLGGDISGMQYFSTSYECISLTLNVDPGYYSFEFYDSYGDGGQSGYFD